MKRLIACVSLVLAIAASVLLFGCASSTSTDVTTTTTTLSSGAAAGSAAYDAVTAVTGISSVTSSLGGLTGASPTGFSVGAAATPPPPPQAFFAPVSDTGWITPEGATLMTGETISIRLYTATGELINAAFLATKKIATLEGFDWKAMTQPGSFSFEVFAEALINWMNYPSDWNGEDSASRAAFYANASKYRSALSLWDYIVWADIGSSGSMESGIDMAWKMYPVFQTPPQPPRPSLMGGYPAIATPEAAGGQKFGTQEARVTGTHPDGSTVDMTMTVSTDADGKPVSSTGHGTITKPGGKTMTVNNTMNFVDGRPMSGNMDMVVSAPDNLHLVLTITGTGGATGKVYSTATSPETEIGSLVIYGISVDGHYGYFEDKSTGVKHYF